MNYKQRQNESKGKLKEEKKAMYTKTFHPNKHLTSQIKEQVAIIDTAYTTIEDLMKDLPQHVRRAIEQPSQDIAAAIEKCKTIANTKHQEPELKMFNEQIKESDEEPPSFAQVEQPPSDSEEEKLEFKKTESQILLQTSISLLKLQSSHPIQKIQSEEGTWAAVSDNPFVALSIMYFDIGRTEAEENINKLRRLIVMTDLSYIQQPVLGSHNAIKKLFLDFLEESKSISTLTILESYDCISDVLICCLQHILLKNKHHYDNKLNIDNIQQLYGKLAADLGLSVCRQGKFLIITVGRRSFKVEVNGDCLLTHLASEAVQRDRQVTFSSKEFDKRQDEEV